MEYSILKNNIYNFDKTGFQIGVISTAKIVTRIKRAERPHIIQPGNHKWVTVIETIETHNFTISPLMIFKAIMHQTAWYKNGLLPGN